MGWIPESGGGTAETGTIVHAADPQSDGSLVFQFGLDADDRPTYTDAGTDDTPAVVVLEGKRFHLREVEY